MAVTKVQGLQAYKHTTIDQIYTKGILPEVSAVVDPEIVREKVYNDADNRYELSEVEVLVDALPDGFVKDFVHYTRGIEAPTEFCMWAGLFAISSIGQRRMAVAHGTDPLVTNMFLIFVGQPGTVRKSTTVKKVESIIRAIPSLYDDEATRKIFKVPIHTGKTTPEALYEMMKPEEVTLREEDMPEAEVVNLGSRMVLTADEMSHLMGKQMYNVGMSDVLLKLFDCKDYDEVATKKDGKIIFENIFFNLFAASTVDGFSSAVPDSAQGSGFMSRAILLFSEDSNREFAVPKVFKGIPSKEEMVRRLGWVGEFKAQVYDLSDEALAWFTKWYSDVKSMFRDKSYGDVEARIEIHTIKIAALIRAQAYEPGNEITANDIKLAALLVERSIEQKREVLGQMWSSTYQMEFKTVRKFIQHGGVGGRSRREMNARFSKDFAMPRLDEIIEGLVAGGTVIIKLDGKQLGKTSKSSKERYIYTGAPDGE